MEIDKLIEICRERNDIEFLYQITKSIAENNFISEEWGYRDYKRLHFNNAEKIVSNDEEYYNEYIEYGSIKIYELYLVHIGVLKSNNGNVRGVNDEE